MYQCYSFFNMSQLPSSLILVYSVESSQFSSLSPTTTLTNNSYTTVSKKFTSNTCKMASALTCLIFLGHIILLLFGIIANYAILFLTGIVKLPMVKENKLLKYVTMTNSKVRLVRLRSDSGSKREDSPVAPSTR